VTGKKKRLETERIFARGSERGTWGEGSLTGDFERYVKEGSGDGIPLHGGPVGGTWRGYFFTGDFERQVKEGSGDGASLSVGALRGEPGRGLLCWGL
jgi:hypothetical protein